MARHFAEWGQVERVRVLNTRGVAFITYSNEANAQFAKEAMAHQAFDHNEILNVRWATADPNPMAQAREAIVKVGFEIEHEEDLADRPDPIPWYYPLEGDIRKAQTTWDYFTVWRMSWSGKLVTHNAIRIMEWFGIVPKGTHDVGIRY